MEFSQVITPRIVITLLLGAFLNIFYLSGFTFGAIFIYLPILGFFFTKTRYASYVFTGRVVLPVTIALLAVYFWVTLHGATEYNYLIRGALRDISSIQNFFEILSTLYAICIAFLLWKGLSDHDNLRNILREEAGIIQSINEFFHYMDDENENGRTIDEIRDVFIRYINNIMHGQKIVVSQENNRFLKQIIAKVAILKINDENDEIALTEIMKQLSVLSIVRARRISYMSSKMSPYLLALLTLISVCLLIPFFIREPSSSYVLHVLIFSLTSFFSFLYVTLVDINNPFDGYWQITTDTFKTLVEYLEEDKLDFLHAEVKNDK